jgi:delta-aminolevulinic acid dehydratase/porphobilinogen synthase
MGPDILRGERILNDETVFVLWEQALNEARAGGRRQPRRRDPRRTRRGKSEKVQILCYAAKYASTF